MFRQDLHSKRRLADVVPDASCEVAPLALSEPDPLYV
jgi:hypothetical protein